ncbi:MAG TPA: histidine kinase dimerization/phospho-acceptor domain-containing protein, partial [bacterium]|nr:histidine kinase dimerization/phospho-acceptor domain-containing protein [bacterium]
MNGSSIRFGIVAKISIVFGALVFCTALSAYFGYGFRINELYGRQREARIRFLADSMSYGMKNILVSSGSDQNVSEIAGNIMRKVAGSDQNIAGCVIRDRTGKKIFEYSKPSAAVGGKRRSVSRDIKSENNTIGTITLSYYINSPIEEEKTRQIISLGNTVASMVTFYMEKMDFFQLKFLADLIIKEDPDVKYAYIYGPTGEILYHYESADGKEHRPGAEPRTPIDVVDAVRPLVVRDVGYFGGERLVEVSSLVDSHGMKLGVVLIGYSTASLARQLAGVRFILGSMLVGLTCVALGLAIVLARNITKPLVELTGLAGSIDVESGAASRKIGDAETEIKRIREAFEKFGAKHASRGDEVGDLATAFKRMIASLEARIEELRLFYRKIGVADRFYAMGQLSAGIAHEINNPLAIISTNTQVALKNKNLDPSLRQDLEAILEETDRISEKVR